MIIDSHIHLGLNDFCKEGCETFKYDLQNSISDYLEFMKQNGIDKALALPMPDQNYDVKKSNSYVFEAALQNPERILPVCRMSSTLLHDLTSGGALAAKYHMVYEKFSSKKLMEYYQLLEYYRTPLIVHAKYLDKPSQIREILKIAPSLPIIIAHMGRGKIYTDEGVREMLSEFSKLENIYFETSTVGRQRTIEEACKIIGSERVIFGTDYPFGKAWFKDTYTYQDDVSVVADAGISSSEKDNIFYKNILRIIEMGTHHRKGVIVQPVGDKWQFVWEKLHLLSAQDLKFLAIDQKWSVIRANLKNNRHSFILTEGDSVVGFFRESGRNEGYSMLEEIVIFPEFRGRGYSKEIMNYYTRFFPKSYAKTNSQNMAMNALLTQYGFDLKGGSRILNWQRN